MHALLQYDSMTKKVAVYKFDDKKIPIDEIEKTTSIKAIPEKNL